MTTMKQTIVSRADMQSLLFLVFLFGITVAAEENHFRIASFNVQVFGATKAAKPDVMNTLAKIVQRYDIVQLLEIRDRKNTAIFNLLKLVNELGPASYGIVISERLGRSSSKEQYAFLYRWKEGIQVLDTYQYPDHKDEFEREPLAVKFASKYTHLKEFVLVVVHIDPDEAVEEIDSLEEVHRTIKAHWKTNNIAMMGDFNADCSYVGKAASKKLVLRDPKYTWLIGDDADTTTKSTDCAYDRIILTGESFRQSIVPDSAAVYHFDRAYDLTSIQTTAVSDHYPVEFEMATVGSGTSATNDVNNWDDTQSAAEKVIQSINGLRLDVARIEEQNARMERMLKALLTAKVIELEDGAS